MKLDGAVSDDLFQLPIGDLVVLYKLKEHVNAGSEVLDGVLVQ